MKDVEALDSVKQAYVKWKDIKSIDVHVVTKETLEDMLSTCETLKHMEERVEFYDDEDEPNYNNWIDVEGEGYGWKWLHVPEEKWHAVLKESMLAYMKEKREQILNREEKVVVVITETQTIYHFIERKASLKDTIYTFSNEEIYY